MKINNALEQLNYIMPEHHELFRLVFNHIIFRDSDSCGGGSVSSAIGLLWLNIKDSLAPNDILELLIHELAHNLLFIDERRYKHYNYDYIALEDNYAVSAILKSRRPLDKVIHSIVVAAEIILARINYKYVGDVNIHPKTDELIRQISSSIKSVLAMPNIKDLVTDRVLLILVTVKDKIKVI